MKITIKREQRRACPDLPNVSNLRNEGAKAKRMITNRGWRRYLAATPLRLLLLAALPAFVLTACSKDDLAPDNTSDGDRIPVTFSAGIKAAGGSATGAAPATRTTGLGNNTWTSTDHIGIIMAMAGYDIGHGENGTDILASNIEYAADKIGTDDKGRSTATFIPVGEHPIYYPRTSKVDFYVYYPHTAKGNNSGELDEYYNYTIDLSDQSNPAAIDVLYADKKEVARSSAPIELSFKHVFAKVTLNVTAGDGVAAADIAALKSEDVKMQFPYSSLVKVQLWNQGETQTSKTAIFPQVPAYKESTASDKTDATFSVIVCPNIDEKTPVRFTIGEETYTVTLDPTVTTTGRWFSGYNYVYPVTVRKKSVEVADEPDIKDWEEEDKGSGSLEMSDMVHIPAGKFIMGSPTNESGRNGDRETQHEVTLTQDFFISKCEITNAQYAEFLNVTGVGANGKANVWGYGERLLIAEKDGGIRFISGKWRPDSKKGQFPVIGVSWYGAKAYADWFGGSLPTEAQWEYACRARSATAYTGGNDAEHGLDDYGWYKDNSGDTTHPVGTKKPNAWGLYDMHGNVWEWCLDTWPGSDYGSDAVTDPVCSGDGNIVRGGAFDADAKDCRSACRNSYAPGQHYSNIGFRVVLIW
ncbi:SUMF1/EgtB/PvdO family nonheme iron enzyme [uncultured Sanguibacteroides sp.]|uniref:SUMF1/EgtB/PvdO family nonheme iron enzyme n=1 Tax=uncultured Sanguibacteroides sp. TaxID=1635151 RepID=UPI002803BB02|nr:SUMF1/EgtB/PvdO family nonheme iron enzyme [uncultured Sanguibacteroides sp.]